MSIHKLVNSSACVEFLIILNGSRSTIFVLEFDQVFYLVKSIILEVRTQR